MDQEPLVEAQIGAGQRFLNEFNRFAEIRCEVWFRESDNGRWYLYIISDRISDADVKLAYRKVLDICRTMDKPRLDPFRIRVIGANTVAATDVLETQRRQAIGTTPAPWPQPLGPGMDEARFYDFPATAVSP